MKYVWWQGIMHPKIEIIRQLLIALTISEDIYKNQSNAPYNFKGRPYYVSQYANPHQWDIPGI